MNATQRTEGTPWQVLPDLRWDVPPALDQDVHKRMIEVITLFSDGGIDVLLVIRAADFDVFFQQVKQRILLDPLDDFILIVDDDIGDDEAGQALCPLMRIPGVRHGPPCLDLEERKLVLIFFGEGNRIATGEAGVAEARSALGLLTGRLMQPLQT